MKKIVAFLWGVVEYRSDCTRHYEDWDLVDAYDMGRHCAHLLTGRGY